MSYQNLVDFLRTVAARGDVLDSLNVRSKDEVIATAGDFGLPFTEPEFDSLIWDLEAHLASKRGEEFGPHFPLWDVMWGRYYFEYLVNDLIPSFADADFREVIAAQAKKA